MAYRYATERRDQSDLASGNVLRSAPGHPGFPVRLADELFQRAAARLPDAPLSLWDPCCGSGHLAASVGLLHRDRLSRLLATDTDPAALSIAERNLALLTRSGLADRERGLRADAAELSKPALLERAGTAARLAERLDGLGGDLGHRVRAGDAFAPVVPEHPVDLVLTDVPYGGLTAFSGAAPAGDPVPALVRALAAVVPGHAVLAVTARTRKVPLPEGVRALERVRVGVRAAALVRAADAAA
ncbi:rRNA methyltransferase [Streptomonospora salina]|uniref:23S rRNA G2445 N2-methylase RlmL n=1 Tax=Streptomonospora salina TaxID=104205 RepID=A0A841E3B0_9ACTN|nr:rRNA methyltransferase [Streptomonospora salina]MBB5998317.1 23S rRNA G2445 N2-methylase RlmL [Streptomonospora salina]